MTPEIERQRLIDARRRLVHVVSALTTRDGLQRLFVAAVRALKEERIAEQQRVADQRRRARTDQQRSADRTRKTRRRPPAPTEPAP